MIAYGVGRFPMEYFRQPDPQFSEGKDMAGWGATLASMGMTQGQFLCLLMVLGGAGLLWFFRRAAKSNPLMQISDQAVAFKAQAMSDQQAGLPEQKTKNA